MNIEQAKTIPITLILDKINYVPQRRNKNEVLYFSPFRNEKTPSFWVNTLKNVWYDFGIGKGGDVVDFAVLYLESQGLQHAVSDGLRYLKNISGYVPIIPPVETYDYTEDDSALVLKNVGAIKEIALIQYAEKRGIPPGILKKYMKQVTVFNKNSGKHFFALGMKNEDDGYELRNNKFKGGVGKKGIIFIRGTHNNYEGINIFEGMTDFLTVMTQRDGKPFRDDTIILNSLSFLHRGAGYIKGFGYRTGYTWMDNDDAGKKATKSWSEFFVAEDNLVHMPMNDTYAPYKDVNAAHIARLELQPQ